MKKKYRSRPQDDGSKNIVRFIGVICVITIMILAYKEYMLTH